MRVIYIAPKNVKQTHRRSHCTSAKRMTSILRHVAEAFSPARQGTILNYGLHTLLKEWTVTDQSAVVVTVHSFMDRSMNKKLPPVAKAN